MLEVMSDQRITAADVLREGSPWRDCEIWDGIPMVREPSGGWAASVASRVDIELGVHLKGRDLGWSFGSEQGFLVTRDPDRLLAPDCAYVSKARLPKIPVRGFVPLVPDFALEVRSSTDRWEATIEKCGIWIAHGAKVVWAVNPDPRQVVVFRPGQEPEIATATGTVTAAPALPEFHLDVAELFEGLEE